MAAGRKCGGKKDATAEKQKTTQGEHKEDGCVLQQIYRRNEIKRKTPNSLDSGG